MEKFVKDLKQRYLNLIESIKGRRDSAGKEDGVATKEEPVEEFSVEERATVVTARGPKRPTPPKGPPPQTA
ncbi:hypothetical protein Tsubulata_018537 [Turnera subulata]|uniref:Uncharacterized protein n=1 Tax=Turnera subulata TaxID=218843 RepID=A0A9Q0GE18_9ROSI|nr:hypothetical protein Tsubulata_018537 [Turnera subulata]